MNKLIKLNPWFITGFTDAEGCFSLSIVRNKKMKAGWQVKQSFQISLHQKDKALLQQIQMGFFGVGSLYNRLGLQVIKYYVQSIKDLKVIIDHFEKYPLITQKCVDYELFKQAFTLILNKEHLTEEGIGKIVAIKGSMNLGLSDELKTAFPDDKLLPIPRPSAVRALPLEIKDPNWLAGFTSGEGCFKIRVINSSNYRLGSQVQLIFQITQHSRDEPLMKSLIEYLNSGNVYIYKEVVDFGVTKFSDLTDKIIPFFQKYPLQGVKSKDFEDFCKVAKMMKEGKHLTPEGLDQIRKIKAGMNRGRKV